MRDLLNSAHVPDGDAPLAAEQGFIVKRSVICDRGFLAREAVAACVYGRPACADPGTGLTLVHRAHAKRQARLYPGPITELAVRLQSSCDRLPRLLAGIVGRVTVLTNYRTGKAYVAVIPDEPLAGELRAETNYINTQLGFHETANANLTLPHATVYKTPDRARAEIVAGELATVLANTPGEVDLILGAPFIKPV